jgi:hypothetical protein
MCKEQLETGGSLQWVDVAGEQQLPALHERKEKRNLENMPKWSLVKGHHD